MGSEPWDLANEENRIVREKTLTGVVWRNHVSYPVVSGIAASTLCRTRKRSVH